MIRDSRSSFLLKKRPSVQTFNEWKKSNYKFSGENNPILSYVGNNELDYSTLPVHAGKSAVGLGLLPMILKTGKQEKNGFISEHRIVPNGSIQNEQTAFRTSDLTRHRPTSTNDGIEADRTARETRYKMQSCPSGKRSSLSVSKGGLQQQKEADTEHTSSCLWDSAAGQAEARQKPHSSDVKSLDSTSPHNIGFETPTIHLYNQQLHQQHHPQQQHQQRIHPGNITHDHQHDQGNVPYSPRVVFPKTKPHPKPVDQTVDTTQKRVVITREREVVDSSLCPSACLGPVKWSQAGARDTYLPVAFVVTFCFNCPFGVLALLCSLRAQQAFQSGRSERGRTLAVASLLLSMLGMIITVVVVIAVAFMVKDNF